MITLILGKKGSGKTKRLIDMCNRRRGGFQWERGFYREGQQSDL